MKTKTEAARAYGFVPRPEAWMPRQLAYVESFGTIAGAMRRAGVVRAQNPRATVLVVIGGGK